MTPHAIRPSRAALVAASRTLALRARQLGGSGADQGVEQAEAQHVALALDGGLGQPGGGSDADPGVGVEQAPALDVDLLALVVPRVGVARRLGCAGVGHDHRGQQDEPHREVAEE
jgi:hypothetical protein